MGNIDSFESDHLPKYVPLPHLASDRLLKFRNNATSISRFGELLIHLRALSGRKDLDFEGLEYSINRYGNDRFFRHVLPFMISMLNKTPDYLIGMNIEFLRQRTNAKVEDADNIDQRTQYNIFRLNEINFDSLHNCPGKYPPTCAKLCMLIHYFDRCAEEMPKGKITIERKDLGSKGFVFPEELGNVTEEHKNDADDAEVDDSKFLNCHKHTKGFCKVFVHPKGSLRDQRSCRQANFANMYIGGSTLATGSAQEEILFCENPECLISMLLCPCMLYTEVIVISGTEQFSKSIGYGRTLEYGGDYQDENAGEYEIVAFDAEDYRREGALEQFKKELIHRDLVKSFTAFSGGNKDISTGCWGCGVFLGDKRLKFMIQWISCSLNSKDLHFYTFEGDNPILAKEIQSFVKTISENKTTVSQLVVVLCRIHSILPTLGENVEECSFLEVAEKMLSGNL